MNHWIQDLRFTIRQLVKSPVFTCTAIVVLALGLCANVRQTTERFGAPSSRSSLSAQAVCETFDQMIAVTPTSGELNQPGTRDDEAGHSKQPSFPRSTRSGVRWKWVLVSDSSRGSVDSEIRSGRVGRDPRPPDVSR